MRFGSELAEGRPEVIHLVAMMYVKYPPSLRNVEDLLSKRGMAGRRSRGRGAGIPGHQRTGQACRAQADEAADEALR
jgi:hypothetical protein